MHLQWVLPVGQGDCFNLCHPSCDGEHYMLHVSMIYQVTAVQK